MDTGYKKCTQCGVIKILTEFSPNKGNKNGIRSNCKNCQCLSVKNKYHSCEETRIKRATEKKLPAAAVRIEASRRKPKAKEKNRDYQRIRSEKDVDFRLAKRLRTRRWLAVKTQSVSKCLHLEELLGCTLQEFKSYLEYRFYPDGQTGEVMTWENYGQWHIDEIIPCSAWDLKDPGQQRLCFHFSNAQPLCAKENFSKGGVDRNPDFYKKEVKRLLSCQVECTKC